MQVYFLLFLCRIVVLRFLFGLEVVGLHTSHYDLVAGEEVEEYLTPILLYIDDEIYQNVDSMENMYSTIESLSSWDTDWSS